MGRRCRVLGAALLLWCLRPDAASAQWRPREQGIEWSASGAVPSPISAPQTAPAASESTANAVFIAAIGSATGIFVGGLVGSSIDRARNVPSEDPGLDGWIYGALAGSALLSPGLLCLAQDRRGPCGRAVLLSVAGTALAAAAFWSLERGLLVVPVVQIGVSVAVLR